MKNHYCLYCAFLGVDYRCLKENKYVKEHIVYTINKCKNFTFNEMDAFNPDKIYKPQAKKTFKQIKLDL